MKTTTGVADTPFFISSNELSFARRQGPQFKLYRVYDFVGDPQPNGKVYIIDGDLEREFTLCPTQYRATLNAGHESP